LGSKPEARLAGNTLKDYWNLQENAGRRPVMMSGLIKLNKIQNKLSLQYWKIKTKMPPQYVQ
jgi:hypothetical protein